MLYGESAHGSKLIVASNAKGKDIVPAIRSTLCANQRPRSIMVVLIAIAPQRKFNSAKSTPKRRSYVRWLFRVIRVVFQQVVSEELDWVWWPAKCCCKDDTTQNCYGSRLELCTQLRDRQKMKKCHVQGAACAPFDRQSRSLSKCATHTFL